MGRNVLIGRHAYRENFVLEALVDEEDGGTEHAPSVVTSGLQVTHDLHHLEQRVLSERPRLGVGLRYLA